MHKIFSLSLLTLIYLFVTSCSTVGIDQAEQLEAELKNKAAHFLNCPVTKLKIIKHPVISVESVQNNNSKYEEKKFLMTDLKGNFFHYKENDSKDSTTTKSSAPYLFSGCNKRVLYMCSPKSGKCARTSYGIIKVKHNLLKIVNPFRKALLSRKRALRQCGKMKIITNQENAEVETIKVKFYLEIGVDRKISVTKLVPSYGVLTKEFYSCLEKEITELSLEEIELSSKISIRQPVNFHL